MVNNNNQPKSRRVRRRNNNNNQNRNTNNAPRRAPRRRQRNMQLQTILPSGVSGGTTQSPTSVHQRLASKELLANLTLANTHSGQVIYNEQITPTIAPRLSHLSQAYQRINWHKARVELVPLNGSNVAAGYIAGFLEDPSQTVPAKPSELIPYVSTLRGATAAQTWVKTMTGSLLPERARPEMYTVLGQNIREFAIGKLLVVMTGNVGTSANFQIWLHYDVELYIPISPPIGGGPTPPPPTPTEAIAQVVVTGAGTATLTYDGTIYRVSHPSIGNNIPVGLSVVVEHVLRAPLYVSINQSDDPARQVLGSGIATWILPAALSIRMIMVLGDEENAFLRVTFDRPSSTPISSYPVVQYGDGPDPTAAVSFFFDTSTPSEPSAYDIYSASYLG